MRAAAALESDAPALPPLFRHHVRRPRLTRLLDACTAPVIVVAAPAGYGKTTLAAEWLQGRPEEEVAWYYASPASADVAALSVGIADAVSHILPAGDRVRQRLRVPEVPDNQAEILAELLAHDLTAWPEHAWLVLDDYHHAMDSESAERFVEELVRLAPIRLLITSRRRPSWVTARRVVYGEVLEFSVSQLAMTSNEASALLRGHGPEVAGTIAEITKGWPALVSLASRARTTAAHQSTVAETQFRFLADEVLGLLPPRQRGVALQAAILPALSPELLKLCLKDVNATRDLDVFRDLGLVQLTNGVYAFHPLLRQFLREQSRLEIPNLARRIALDAITHLKAAHAWEGAFAIAVETGEQDAAADVAALAASTFLAEGRLETLDKWLGHISSDGLQRPQIALIHAEMMIRRSRFAEAAALAHDALETLPNESHLQARALSVLAESHHLRSECREALRLHRRAFAAARSAEDARRAAWGIWVASHQLPDQDCAEALGLFKTVIGSDATAHLRASLAEFLVRERQGTYAGSEARFCSVLRLSRQVTEPMAVSSALVLAAFHEIVRAEYRRGEALLSQLFSYCKEFHLSFARALVLTYQVWARIGLRDIPGARSALSRLRHIAEASEDPLVRLDLDTLTWKLRIATGSYTNHDPDEILVAPAPESELPAHAVADRAALRSLMLASMGHSSDLPRVIRDFSQPPQTPVARCLMSFATALNALRETSDSACVEGHISDAIRLAHRVACHDSLVVAYRLEPRLLEFAGNNHALSTIVKPVVRRANDHKRAREHGLVLHGGAGATVGGLTKRELDVMTLLSEGLSNAEIAQRLFISLSTAKVHVHHILEKLEVQNRIQAVVRWRELNGG